MHIQRSLWQYKAECVRCSKDHLRACSTYILRPMAFCTKRAGEVKGTVLP